MQPAASVAGGGVVDAVGVAPNNGVAPPVVPVPVPVPSVVPGSLAATGATGTATARSNVNGGRFDFDDGGAYYGGWEESKAHGHGVCTGPKGQGAYSGSWHYGFEVSGVYTWPSGSTYEGQWQNGKRHGLGVESRGRWIYRGEWTQGFKGRYGVRQSNTSTAKYEGTWANGLQDGYGSETYADDGTYQGQWLRGMRHGYGVRHSAPFGKASKYRTNKTLRASLTSLRSNEGGTGPNPELTEKRDRRVDDSRGGFVLKMNSSEPPAPKGASNIKSLLMSKIRQKSTGDLDKKGSGSIRSTGSTASWVSTDSGQSAMTTGSMPSDSNASFVIENEHLDPSVTETYMGEWKNDKRSGFGISERSDGLKYEGEWYNNKKYGYGVTTFSNGEKEEGKYKNNVLITSQKKKHLFLMRSAKFRERIDAAVNAAQRASKIALQKADIAITRTATARGKAEQADIAAAQAREDSYVAEEVARRYAPEFKPIKSKNPYRYVEPAIIQKDIVANEVSNQISNKIPHNIPNQITNSLSDPETFTKPHIGNQIPKANAIGAQFNTSETFQQQQPPQPFPYKKTATVPYNSTGDYDHQQQPQQQNEPNLRPRNSLPNNEEPQPPAALNAQRRMSRRPSRDRPTLGSIGQQSSKDIYGHYNNPPSRDASVEKFRSRTSAGNSRQVSVERSSRLSETPDRGGARAPSAVRGATPGPANLLRNGIGGKPEAPAATTPPPFEEAVMRRRGLGQDILPSPNPPKRTESLFSHNPAPAAPVKAAVAAAPLQRKKSLPDFQELPRSTGTMSREEIYFLSSARREEVRRQQDERERLRANPLLFFVSPQVKDWFSRQQLVILVLFVNISLAIMFIKLLT